MHPGVDTIFLLFESGGHNPCPADPFAPFCPDTSQRILVIHLDDYDSIFVMKTEVLLELARERGGMDFEWEQWRAHAAKSYLEGGVGIWLNGPRLFCLHHDKEDGETWVDVYDLSPRGAARCTETIADEDGTLLRVLRPSTQKHRLPRDLSAVRHSDGSCDGIVLLMVNTSRFPNLAGM